MVAAEVTRRTFAPRIVNESASFGGYNSQTRSKENTDGLSGINAQAGHPIICPRGSAHALDHVEPSRCGVWRAWQQALDALMVSNAARRRERALDLRGRHSLNRGGSKTTPRIVTAAPKQPEKFLLEALEPRLFLSAASGEVLAAVGATTAVGETVRGEIAAPAQARFDYDPADRVDDIFAGAFDGEATGDGE